MGKPDAHPWADRTPAPPPPGEPAARQDRSEWNAIAMKLERSTSGGPFGSIGDWEVAEGSLPLRSQAGAEDKQAAELHDGDGMRGPVWEYRRRPR